MSEFRQLLARVQPDLGSGLKEFARTDEVLSDADRLLTAIADL